MLMSRRPFDASNVPFRHRGEGRLPADLEDLIQRVIGAAIEVHKTLGPGYLEAVYEEALAAELEHLKIQHQRQAPFEIHYRDRVVGSGRLDILVDGALIIELKAVEKMGDLFTAQTISYLKATNKKAALLINFNGPLLKHGLHRIIL